MILGTKRQAEGACSPRSKDVMRKQTNKTISKAALFAALLTGSFGCDMMRTDQRIVGSEAVPIACKSNAGSYSLPKSLLKFKIKKQGEEKYVLQEIKQVRREDRLHNYCLRYRGSITADDTIYVRKALAIPDELRETLPGLFSGKDAKATTPEADASDIPGKSDASLLKTTNLLFIVSSKAIDRSAQIAQDLVKSLFDIGAGLSGSARLQTFGDNETVLDIEFDPFEPYQTAAANQALRDFGFCAVLGGYNFDLQSARIDDYCDKPIMTIKKAPPVVGGRFFHELLDEYRTPLEELPKGILYRPEMSYTLYVFGRRKDKKKSGHEWRLKIKKEVQLENISPLVAVRLTRTYFAERRTDLVFIGGILQNVCIRKTAPVVEAVKIPLVVVKSIVALPTRILQLRISSASNRAQLVETQQRLITAQINHLKALRAPSPPADVAPAEFSSQPLANIRTTGLGKDGKIRVETEPDFLCPGVNVAELAKRASQ